MDKVFTFLLIIVALVLTEGCSNGASKPDKEVVFDMSNDYGLSSYVVLEENRASYREDDIAKDALRNALTDDNASYFSVASKTTKAGKALYAVEFQELKEYSVDYDKIKITLTKNGDYMVKIPKYSKESNAIIKHVVSKTIGDANPAKHVFCKIVDKQKRAKIANNIDNKVLEISCVLTEKSRRFGKISLDMNGYEYDTAQQTGISVSSYYYLAIR